MKWVTGRPVTRKTGSNDAARVVWAFGEFFHFFSCFFNTNLCVIVLIAYILWKSRQGGQRRIKWAIVEFFSPFFTCLFSTNLFLVVFKTSKLRIGRQEASYDDGPNDARHVVWALGVCVFFFAFFLY